jgi:hypothetical protein
MNADLAGLAEKHGVDRRFDDPNAYGRSHSHYGDGKYPPDWPARREAVWAFQKYQCGRCGAYKGDAAVTEVHHVQHLQHGGTNHLDNLVGLCGDCHSLMHPEVSDLRGDYRRAPVYPAEYSDDRVAVVREPLAAADGAYGLEEWQADLRRLEAVSSPGANHHAVSSAAISTSPETARRAEAFQDILLENRLVPLTTNYHRVNVEPQFPGLRGSLTDYQPDIHVESTVEAGETFWDEDHYRLRYPPDATRTVVTVSGPDGEAGRHDVILSGHDHDGTGARLRVEQRVSPPSLSPSTLPGYLASALRYFVGVPLLLGLLPVLLLLALQVATLPTSLPAVAALSVVVGNVLRLPWTVRDVRSDPETQVVDERTEN